MFNSGKWTKARYESFIKGVLRKGSTRWPPKYEVLNQAKRGKRINESTGRLAEHYECAECGKEFPAKFICVDHIEPVVPVSGFVSWDSVVERMFCEVGGLQVLCKDCHKIKTEKERLERKLHNKNNSGEVNE